MSHIWKEHNTYEGLYVIWNVKTDRIWREEGILIFSECWRHHTTIPKEEFGHELYVIALDDKTRNEFHKNPAFNVNVYFLFPENFQ